MRTSKRFLSLLLLFGAACCVPNLLVQVSAQDGAEKPKSQEKSSRKEKPLRLQDDTPLLLLDDEAGDPEAGADNSRCTVCHLNLGMEEMVVTHAREDIGCADCHGQCDEHIDDESWATGGPGTPPDIMFPPDKIDAACGECHDTHDVPAQSILERWKQRCPEKTDVTTVVCTDCHGKHRVVAKLRKAWWDKRTGKPLKNRP